MLTGFVLMSGIGAAVFEGSSIGVLGLAVSILVGEDGLPALDIPGQIGVYIDNVVRATSRGGIFLILVGIAVAMQVAKSLFIYGSQTAQVYLNVGMRRDAQNEVTKRIMDLSYSDFSRNPVGAIAGIIDQAQGVQTLVDMASNVSRAVFMLVAYLALVAWMSLPMTLAVTVVAVLIWLALNKITDKIKVLSKKIARSKVYVWRWTIEFLNAPKLLRIFNSAEYAGELINRARDDVLFPERKSAVIEAAIKPAMEIVTIIGAGCFLVVGYLISADSAISAIPKLFVFVVIFHRLKTPIQSLSDIRVKLARALPQLEVVAAFLLEGTKKIKKKSIKQFSGLKKEIDLNNVSFQYSSETKLVLQNISFSIPVGKTVALVGASGAGKSTIADLLIGLFDVTSGEILIDGENLENINSAHWRERIGVVEQDVFLLNTSILENIKFARPNATLESVLAASKMAHAHEFIQKLENGYDTIVGDRGYGLSGGQQQRISLARALLLDPKILILDEATSALDSESERMIQNALEDMHNNRTILVIAHRLSTIVNADKIIVLEEGKVVEHGTKEELVTKAGRFATLWELQDTR